MPSEPLVSVLTPVYNGEEFLLECIESVLNQTYGNYEYIVVNNCSTDRTLEIASKFAERDSRIRIRNNNEFVGVIENHNIAFRLISAKSKYCKVVSADDTIFPDCITRMVEVAELHPSAGMVGSYQQSGKSVLWQGFPYPKAILTGRDLCRQIFLDGNPSFGFGTPTSLLYRADLVRNAGQFYPNPSPHADTSACFSVLRDSDFAFVYQVLCWERTHEQRQSSRSAEINRYSSAYLNDVIQYGPSYLTNDEYERLLQKALHHYHEFLAVNLFRSRDKEFWDYHKSRFKELGFPINTSILAKAGMIKIFREMVNPVQMVSKLQKRSCA
jgi:glycosyltransferase involved in cell wall biosynthesis